MLRLLVGVILFISGGAKVCSPRQFAAAIDAYGFVHKKWELNAIAGLIVILETIIGTGLCTTRFAVTSAIAALWLLTAFSAAVATVLLRGRRPSKCGCMVFRRDAPLGWYVCVRNAAIMALLIPTLLPVPQGFMAVAAAALIVVAIPLMNAEGERNRVEARRSPALVLGPFGSRQKAQEP